MYHPPESSLIVEEQLQSSFTGKWLAVLGTLLLLGLPIGLISTLISMVETFQAITLYGTGDPKVMAGAISGALVSTVLGLVVALPGAILLAISIILFKHRRPWIYRVSFVSAIIALLLFPIGTVVGIIILVKLVGNKSNYYLKAEK